MKHVNKLLSLCMKPYKVQLILPVIFTLIASIMGGLNPYIIGLAITELGNNVKDIMSGIEGAAVNYQYILIIIIALALSSLIRQGFMYLGSYILSGGVQNGFRDLRSRISRKMHTLPVSYFDKNQHGTILSVVTNDVDAVSNALQQSLIPIVYSVTSILTTFIMMLYISIPLGLASMLLVPIALLLSRVVTRRSQKHFRKRQNALAELTGYIQERYTGFTVTKLYNNEQETVEKFKSINDRLNKSAFKSNFISSLMSPLMEFLINITYAIMLLFTGWAVLSSGMTLGNMQAFVQYIWLIYEPVGNMTQLLPALQSALASVERIVNFLDEPDEIGDVGKAETLDVDSYKGRVEFDHIRFSYSKKKPLIKDFSLIAEAGQKVAIVGATGAGKTTIINLLMRFYDINEGDIRIDGDSIYDMRRSAERSLFGMVLQDAWLYHASIADNIRFGKLDATDEEIVQAAKEANVHHFIKTMPGGYNMMINEEANNVSLGQKQLLTIARALLADPHILILDEATSSVDTRLEMLIQVAMKRAMKGRTSFVIAHRLSTIRDADLIVVMDGGDIVEQGTHQELLSRSGVYERLYNSQFEEE